jgi:predicted nucleic acid-binding Zn ribbon protein
VPEKDPADPVSMARAALAAARADARARGIRPATPIRPPPVRDSEPIGEPEHGAGDAPTGGSPQAAHDDVAVDGPVPGPSGPGIRPAGDPGAGRAGRRGARRPGAGSGARPGFALQPRRADPQPLGAAINHLLDAEGWGLAAATGSVFGRWAQIVGADLAAHTTPESLSDGELTVTADSTAWATQVRLLAAQLVRRLNMELGDGTVQRVKVRGPVTATRKPGEWRVRGGRGPRDTYG